MQATTPQSPKGSDGNDQIITLGELRSYKEQGFYLEEIMELMTSTHGIARIFEADTALGHCRYFVLLLDKEGNPVLTKDQRKKAGSKFKAASNSAGKG